METSDIRLHPSWNNFVYGTSASFVKDKKGGSRKIPESRPSDCAIAVLYFLISYPQYCITSSQNIAFAQENHSLV